jgi:glutamate-1-semialdehyde 2,1-aminomutase
VHRTEIGRYRASVGLHETASRVLAGGVSSNFRLGGTPAPLWFDRGEGARLFDVDGNSYVDYALGMGPNILGHAPDRVVRRVAESLNRGQLFAGQHASELELARGIQRLVPCAERVRIGVTGSELTQAAVRLARAYTGRSLVVKFEGHYHGWFDSLLVSVAPPMDSAGSRDAPIPHLPSAGQSRSVLGDIAILPWNDLRALESYLLQNGPRVAALIMEPILCNTGVIPPRSGYLEDVRALCDRYRIVLIFDEVITGFRVGLSGAQGRLGVTPDLAVFAKALGGGFPIAALAGSRDIMELVASGGVVHGGTFNANVVSVVAALAVLEELERPGTYAQLEAQGHALMDGLRAIANELELPLLVQGLGPVFNTAFTNQRELFDYRTYAMCDLGSQRRFLRELQDRGVRPTSRGTWFLSTAHGDSEVAETLGVAAAALRAVRDASGDGLG